MRKVAIAVVVLAAGAVAVAAALARTAPTLRVVQRAPLVVRGAHFHPAERVTLRARGIVRVVHTTAAGAFHARLGVLSTDRCTSRIVAVGARGDRAQARIIPPRTMCSPATSP